uniref:ANK_REP_REGION domain-containing protein n=1 Tax=Macrostomum lignano TaxID=282301 RepID=A0A1I8FYP6_9PLAT
MRVLIDCGADLNAANSLGDTPIYQACLEGHVTAAELLIRSGAYLNLPNASGITPLMIACFTGAEAVVELLLRYGARVDCRDVAGKTAAHYCCPARALDCLRLLVRAGRRHQPADGAAYQGASDQLLDLLLSAAPESALAARDCRDRGALFTLSRAAACRRFSGSCAPALQLERRSERRHPADDGGSALSPATCRTARRPAAQRGATATMRTATGFGLATPKPDLLQLLLDSGLPAEKATDGSTLLMACIARRNWTLVDFLLRRADSLAPLVDLAAVDSAGESALTLAVRAQNQQLLHQLIGMGGAAVTDGENFPKRWRRLLQLACQCGNAEAAMLFAEMAKPDDLAVAAKARARGDDGLLFFCVRARGTATAAALADGTTAAGGKNLFHEACATGRLAMVQMLMQELPEQQILLKDAQGRNAYFYAVQSGSADLLDLLDGTPGLEPTPDNRGVTLLMLALAAADPGGQAAVLQQLRSNLGHYGLTESAVDSDGRGAAFYAAESDSWPLVEDLLTRAGTSEEPRDKAGRTLLMHSAACGSATERELLRIEPGRLDANGENALFYAVRARNSELAAALLRGGLAPAPNSRGQSILALAYATGQGRLAELLLTTPGLQTADLLNGCDDQRCTGFQHLVIEQRVDHLARLAGLFEPARDSDEREESALIKAARQANPRMLKLLLEAFNGLDVGRVDAEGMNALSHAVLAGSFKSCKLLLAYGVRPMLPAAKDGSTLLHLGARSGNVQVFMHLLRFFVPSGIQQEAAAMLNARDANGTSVAHILCELGLWDCAEAFHRRGGWLCGGGGSSESSEDLRDKKGRSPAMLAALSNNLVLMKLMLHLCQNTAQLLEEKDLAARTCLHYACQLLDRRADPQAADADGLSPLHLAVQGQGSVKAVRLLLDRGADPFKQTRAGANAFEMCAKIHGAAGAGGRDCLQLLESLFQLDQSQRETIEAYSKRLGEVDLAELASQMAKRDVILCEHNARVMELMNQRAERRDYMLSLVIRRGKTRIQDFLTELKQFNPQVAMELRAKLFVKPESEFMV